MHNIRLEFDTAMIAWKEVAEILKTVGMAHYEPEKHRKAFEASYCTLFLFHEDKLIGFGRALSDGQYQAAIYDCAVTVEFQGKGFGRLIVETILAKLPECNVMLYAAPGKEDFYRKLGFRLMKTGMASFMNTPIMAEKGFTE